MYTWICIQKAWGWAEGRFLKNITKHKACLSIIGRKDMSFVIAFHIIPNQLSSLSPQALTQTLGSKTLFFFFPSQGNDWKKSHLILRALSLRDLNIGDRIWTCSQYRTRRCYYGCGVVFRNFVASVELYFSIQKLAFKFTISGISVSLSLDISQQVSERVSACASRLNGASLTCLLPLWMLHCH